MNKSEQKDHKSRLDEIASAMTESLEAIEKRFNDLTQSMLTSEKQLQDDIDRAIVQTRTDMDEQIKALLALNFNTLRALTLFCRATWYARWWWVITGRLPPLLHITDPMSTTDNPEDTHALRKNQTTGD